MDEIIKKEIEKFILRKLVRHRIWTHKHTSIHNLQKGLPDHLKSRKEVRKAIEDLLKNKFISSKPTHYGLEVSLNIEMKKEIEDIIELK
ncbi:hypothetical protein J4423_00455 [Candidatus Pacearchaeota archaeon]|nr:hypothetical protein [Candidatus Pacearchaeota archaeon]